jgi:uncharacterized membrane protein YqjE
VEVLKQTYLIFLLVLIIFAWPAYYLYQRQLGAIPFLLVAIFFFYVTVKKVQRLKKHPDKEEKIKRNSR